MPKNTHDVLAALLERTTCKPGWRFRLDDDPDDGLRLVIFVPAVDSRRVGNINVNHLFPVPTATYNERAWRRWVFECCRKVEDHELGEWFLVDRQRPFAPLHAPGENPYDVREVSTELEARTNQQGEVEP